MREATPLLQKPGDKMKFMRALPLAVLCLALLTFPAQGQVDSQDAYDFMIGKLSAESNDFDDAITRLDRVIAKNPGDPVLLYERAMVLLAASRLDKGEAELRKLVQQFPDFYDARRLLGRLLLDRSGGDPRKVEEGLVHLKDAFRLYPGDVITGSTIAQILMSLDRPEEAEKVIATLLEQSPDQRMLNYTYAQILTRLGRGDEARPHLERVLTGDPSYAPAVFQLVDIYQKSSEWTKAAEALEPLVSRDPGNLDLQRQQAFFFLRGGESRKALESLQMLHEVDPSDDRTAFYLAEALSDSGEREQADAIYKRLLEKNPGDADLLVSFGLSQLAQRNYPEAETTFRTLLGTPGLAENGVAMARTQLALIDLQRNDDEGALAKAKEVLIYGEKPNLQAINIALDVLRREKRHAEALELLDPLVASHPTDAYLNARYVEFLLRSGEKDKARSLAESQLRMPNSKSITVADAFASAEEYATGIELLEGVRKKDPESRDILFELGSFYERASRYADAEKVFLELLERHPGDAPTLNYLGYMWADRNENLERAETMLIEAVAAEPRNGAYVDSLGWVYFRLGKLDLAEKYLKEAARLIPGDPTIQEHLGDLFAKQGEYQLALEKYKEALSLRPQPKEKAVLETKLAEAERLATAAVR